MAPKERREDRRRKKLGPGCMPGQGSEKKEQTWKEKTWPRVRYWRHEAINSQNKLNLLLWWKMVSYQWSHTFIEQMSPEQTEFASVMKNGELSVKPYIHRTNVSRTNWICFGDETWWVISFTDSSTFIEQMSPEQTEFASVMKNDELSVKPYIHRTNVSRTNWICFCDEKWWVISEAMKPVKP